MRDWLLIIIVACASLLMFGVLWGVPIWQCTASSGAWHFERQWYQRYAQVVCTEAR